MERAPDQELLEWCLYQVSWHATSLCTRYRNSPAANEFTKLPRATSSDQEAKGTRDEAGWGSGRNWGVVMQKDVASSTIQNYLGCKRRRIQINRKTLTKQEFIGSLTKSPCVTKQGLKVFLGLSFSLPGQLSFGTDLRPVIPHWLKVSTAVLSIHFNSVERVHLSLPYIIIWRVRLWLGHRPILEPTAVAREMGCTH